MSWFEVICDFFDRETNPQKMWLKRVKRNPRKLLGVPEEYLRREICERAFEYNQSLEILNIIPKEFKTREMCERAVIKDPCVIGEIPEEFKTREMFERAVKENPCVIGKIPEEFKTREMCERAAKENPCVIGEIPEEFKTREMCERAVIKDPCILVDSEKIPEEFKTREMYFRLIRENVRVAFFLDVPRQLKEDPEFVEMIRCKGGNGDCKIGSDPGPVILGECKIGNAPGRVFWTDSHRSVVINCENCHKVICSKHHRMYDNPNIPYNDRTNMDIPICDDDRGMRKIRRRVKLCEACSNIFKMNRFISAHWLG